MACLPVIKENIQRMNQLEGYDVVIVCTSTLAQANYWQDRLTETRGIVMPADCYVVAVHEDWEGGAGNGLGTLYAYQKAVAKAKELYDLDINARLMEGTISAAMFHTAGKGTRLAPLPGSESNNKPGVKLPASMDVNGRSLPLTILEAVIKQTGVYAPSRVGRLSVFWGDQIFIPSTSVSYDARYHADILASLGDMPNEEEWTRRGLDKYGLVAVNEEGSAAQIEKVSHATATRLLASLGDIKSVGTSLGSFSVSSKLLQNLMMEFSSELAAKEGKLDADPHFWMPMTLDYEGYLEIMAQKGTANEEAAEHFHRIQRMLSKMDPTAQEPLFGCVDVGTQCFWWDYGQLRLYMKNTLLLTAETAEAECMRRFLGVEDAVDKSSFLGVGFQTDDSTRALASTIEKGSAKQCILNNVNARYVEATSSMLVNVSATAIRCGKNCLIYNVLDQSVEGITLGDNEVLAGVYTAEGEMILMRSSMDVCGGKAWSQKVEGNAHSFEDIYKLNQEADVEKIEALCRSRQKDIVEGLATSTMKSPHGDQQFHKICTTRLASVVTNLMAHAV